MNGNDPQHGYQGGGPAAYQGRAGGFDAVEERARAFIWKTFGWMSSGLGITGLVAMVISIISVEGFTPEGRPMLTDIGEVVFQPFVFFGAMVVTFLMVLGISALGQRLHPAVSGGLFFLYAGLNGIWLSAIFLAYTATSIASTFFITAGMFAVTGLFGYFTKRDLTGVGSLAFMGLIGIILASIVNFFVASSILHWVISYVGVAVFVGLTAYDTQKLRQLGGMGLDAHSEARASVQGALALYLDFLNLFLFLLRLFGDRR